VILVAVLLLALVVGAVAYPFARIIDHRRHRRGEPTWWALKLHSGDRAAALAADRRRHAAREERRTRRRSR
jgi:hypothetical protein